MLFSRTVSAWICAGEFAPGPSTCPDRTWGQRLLGFLGLILELGFIPLLSPVPLMSLQMALSVIVLAILKVCAPAGLWLAISSRKPMTARGKQKPCLHDRRIHADCPKRNRHAGHALTARFQVELITMVPSREAVLLRACCSNSRS